LAARAAIDGSRFDLHINFSLVKVTEQSLLQYIVETTMLTRMPSDSVPSLKQWSRLSGCCALTYTAK